MIANIQEKTTVDGDDGHKDVYADRIIVRYWNRLLIFHSIPYLL
jgi:hypothetical protein